ncbi:hypothetical protein M0802_008751 [Mischocyttarus mexicanus]|nr:hypothetical protein M0802_008751 [Mischocyttarus mexicanus]
MNDKDNEDECRMNDQEDRRRRRKRSEEDEAEEEEEEEAEEEEEEEEEIRKVIGRCAFGRERKWNMQEMKNISIFRIFEDWKVKRNQRKRERMEIE